MLKQIISHTWCFFMLLSSSCFKKYCYGKRNFSFWSFRGSTRLLPGLDSCCWTIFPINCKINIWIFFILKKEKDQNLGWLMNSVEVSYMWNCPSVLLISTEVASSLIFFLGYNGDNKIFISLICQWRNCNLTRHNICLIRRRCQILKINSLLALDSPVTI